MIGMFTGSETYILVVLDIHFDLILKALIELIIA